MKVDAAVKIRTGQSEEMMSLASKFFLNKGEDMIIRRVQENASPDLKKMGLPLQRLWLKQKAAEPLSKVDKITMYGEGNSAKLLSDIVNGTTQVTEGISAGMGIDIKSLIMGALGGKIAADTNTPVVVVQPAKEASATQDEEPENK